MSRTLRVVAVLLLLVVCLLVSSPARLLALVLPSDQVVMQGFSGTLWRGSASRCLVNSPAGYLHLGAVSWRLKPLSLLLFAPRLDLNSKWGNQALSTELTLRGGEDIDIHALEASIPADLLRQFVPISLAGTLSAQLEQLSVRDGLPVAGDGRLVWQDGVWNAPNGPLPLGSYALDFSQPEGAPLLGEVVTLAGEVSAEGTVRLAGRSYDIDILLLGDGGLDERLQQALSLMARPVEGGYRLKLDGEF